MKDQDHYAVLRVAPNADQVTIKAAYRTRIRKCHPDLNPDLPGATRLSASLNLAYDVLCSVMRSSAAFTIGIGDKRTVRLLGTPPLPPAARATSGGNQANRAQRPIRPETLVQVLASAQAIKDSTVEVGTPGPIRLGVPPQTPANVRDINSRDQANRTAGASSKSHQRASYHWRQRTGRNSHSYTAGSNFTSSDRPSNEQQQRSEGQDSQTNGDGNAAYSHEQGVGNTQATSVAFVIFTKLGRICRTFGVAVMLSIEILSVPPTMIGVGAVLAAFGVYMVASVAMDYVIMALLGAPAAVFGLAILIYISEWRLMMLGCVVAAVGAFFAFAGVYMTVTSAPMAVMLTMVGSVTIVLAVRSGRSQNDFTSKRIHLVS